MTAGAPPMQGGEYLSLETMERIWTELDDYVHRDIARSPGAFRRGFVPAVPSGIGSAASASTWPRTHTMPSIRSPSSPPTLRGCSTASVCNTSRSAGPWRSRRGRRYRQTLIRLLTPVKDASEKCPWVKALVDSGEIFHPLRWTPRKLTGSLKDVPLLETSGLLVRVPDWWTQRPARVRVTASVGRSQGASFSAQSMLEFRIDLAVEGEPLTPSETAELLAGEDGLRYLKGRWVEVDRERLAAAFSQWKRVEREAGHDGVSFLEGMRLLARAPIRTDLAPLFEGESSAWSEVRAVPGSRSGSASFARQRRCGGRCRALSSAPRCAPTRKPGSAGSTSSPIWASAPAWRTTWDSARRSR